MTIHGSKGLQAPVVVVSGLFAAGKADASMSVQDNILVTPQVLAGRIQPWRAKDRPEDGLWAFAAEMNKAQDKAELRRKFYVALTRVKDRLIITGSPGNVNSSMKRSGRFRSALLPTSNDGSDVHRGAAARNVVCGRDRPVGIGSRVERP